MNVATMKATGFYGIIATLGTSISAWLGGWDVALKLLILLMVTDYLTGLAAAAKAKKVNSDVMFWGGIRKGAILLVLAIGVLVDQLVGNESPMFRTIVVFYYIGREGLSVTENLGLLGLPLPQALIDMLEQLNAKAGKRQSDKAGIRKQPESDMDLIHSDSDGV